MDIRRLGQIKIGDEILGNRTRVKIVKNKVAPPFKQVEFDIVYGKGISKIGEIVDLGVELNVLKKSGANFYYNETKLALGRDKLVKALEENPDLVDELDKKIRALIASGASIKEMSKEEKVEAEKEESEELASAEE